MNRSRTDEINAKGFVDLTHPDYKLLVDIYIYIYIYIYNEIGAHMCYLIRSPVKCPCVFPGNSWRDGRPSEVRCIRGVFKAEKS